MAVVRLQRIFNVFGAGQLKRWLLLVMLCAPLGCTGDDDDGGFGTVRKDGTTKDTVVDSDSESGEDSGQDSTPDTDPIDQDGDGHPASTDCDDENAWVYPDATEICDGLDNDCDDEIDEDVATTTWYADSDGDGFGDANVAVEACSQPSGTSGLGSDCDDTDANVKPGADEVCDGIDNDCDGKVDGEDPGVEDASTWYADTDGDGYGDDDSDTDACSQPSGFVAQGGDCDDTNAAIYPGAAEPDCTDPVDYNCDSVVAYADVDGDGYPECEDCDDTNADIFPGADETCDGADNDCDGLVDDDDDVIMMRMGQAIMM